MVRWKWRGGDWRAGRDAGGRERILWWMRLKGRARLLGWRRLVQGEAVKLEEAVDGEEREAFAIRSRHYIY
jgi:hypothetical protein